MNEVLNRLAGMQALDAGHNIFADPIEQRQHLGGVNALVAAQRNNVGESAADIKSHPHQCPPAMRRTAVVAAVSTAIVTGSITTP